MHTHAPGKRSIDVERLLGAAPARLGGHVAQATHVAQPTRQPDQQHNMRSLSRMPPEARRRSAEETLDIYAPLAGRMGMHGMREELEDLAFRELNSEAYAVISERLDALEAKNVGLV